MTNRTRNTDESDVQGASVRKVTKESGRMIRPSTAEIRYEVKRLLETSVHDDFDQGVLAALQWALGERKTLRRPDK